MSSISAVRRQLVVAKQQVSNSRRRASDRGLLPIRLDDYLKLLDWTGRLLVRGKRGAIPKHLAPILERIGILADRADHWLNLVTNFNRLFSHVVGTSAQVAASAAQAGRRCYRGRANCADAFG